MVQPWEKVTRKKVKKYHIFWAQNFDQFAADFQNFKNIGDSPDDGGFQKMAPDPDPPTPHRGKRRTQTCRLRLYTTKYVYPLQ